MKHGPIKVTIKRETLLGHGPRAQDKVQRPADVAAQVLERVAALFEKYGVPEGDWEDLAIKLAFAHASGRKLCLEHAGFTRRAAATAATAAAAAEAAANRA